MEQLSFHARQALDALVYAVAVTAIVVVGAAAVSFVLGGNWLGVKFILFFVGIGLFGIGTFQLRPTPPWRDEKRLPSLDSGALQPTLQRLPPLDRYGLPADDRLPIGAKLLLASVLVLAFSFALETVFGVTR